MPDTRAAPTAHDPVPAQTGSDAGRLASFALLLLIPAFWSANYIVARIGAPLIEPHQLALARWSTAAVVMLAMAWSAIRAAWPAWRREIPQFFVFGALGMGMCGVGPYYAGRSTSAVNIGLIYTLSPMLILFLSSFVLRERVGPRQWLGAAVALLGVLLVVFEASWDHVLALRLNPGDLWVFAAVLAWTAYSVLLTRWKSALDPSARLALIATAGSLCVLPGAVVETVRHGLPHVDAQLLGLILVAAFVPGIGAYRSYAYAQARLGASRTSVVLYLGPLYAGLLGWLLLNEPIRWFHAAGAALILPGLWMATRPAPR